MTAAEAIDLCRNRGVILAVEGGEKLTVAKASLLSAKELETLRQLKPAIIFELTRLKPTQYYCATCGSIATFGFDCKPLLGIEGTWFCAEHKPPRA